MAVSASLSGIPMNRQPLNSRVLLNRDPDRLTIDIPPRHASREVPVRTIATVVLLGVVALFCLIVLLSFSGSSQALSIGGVLVALLVLLPFGFLGLLALRSLKSTRSDSHHLVLDRDQFELVWQRRGKYHPLAEGKTADLEKATVESYMGPRGKRRSRLVLWEGTKPHDFGLTAEGAALSEVEQNWLAEEINSFLRQVQGWRFSK